jgi:hypothetical protein
VPDFSDVPQTIERLLRGVDHRSTSTTKYRPFEKYLANVLDLQEGGVYTTHVAKPGNFDVRMTQSERARDARLRIALLPSEADLANVIDLAARIARVRKPGTAVLLICDTPDGWITRWGIEPEATGQPSGSPGNLSRFRDWFDDFELHAYLLGSPGDRSAGQGTLDALLTDQQEPSVPPSPAEEMLKELSDRPELTKWLYRQSPDLFTRVIENDISAHDVVAIAHRRTVVERFQHLLRDPQYFNDAAEPFGGKKEAVWQNLLEENPWILGVSLVGQLLTSWSEDKLEQVVAGFSVSGPGKRTDALMHTSGRIRALVFAEIKHHKTDLLSGEYRPGAWSPSSELSGGVAQVQQTIHLASRQIGERLSETDESGAETGEHIYLVRPRSFLILGNLDELRGQSGVHRAKYESFELYRRNLYEPEIITFDELLARAEWHASVVDEEL